MKFFAPDPLDSMTNEQLSKAAGGTGIGLSVDNQSLRQRAADRLQETERRFSVKSENAWKPMLAGEAARFATSVLLRKNPAAKAAMEKYNLGFDAASNLFGANSATNAGEDPYGRTNMNPETGSLEQLSPSGNDAGSTATNSIEAIISAGQWNPYTAIPAYAIGGEMTESQIHAAGRDVSPHLRAISAAKPYTGEDSQYQALVKAVENLRVANTAPAEPGKLSAALWEGLRADKKSLIDRHLNDAAADLSSGDEERVRRASETIPILSTVMDRFNADMEVLQTSSQEYTWPVKRAAEFADDEMAPYLSGERLWDTISGNIPSSGFLDFWNPAGKNMAAFKQRQRWTGANKGRKQGLAHLEDMHARAMQETGGVPSRVVVDKKQQAIADNFSVADPGFGLYQ